MRTFYDPERPGIIEISLYTCIPCTTYLPLFLASTFRRLRTQLFLTVGVLVSVYKLDQLVEPLRLERVAAVYRRRRRARLLATLVLAAAAGRYSRLTGGSRLLLTTQTRTATSTLTVSVVVLATQLTLILKYQRLTL